MDDKVRAALERNERSQAEARAANQSRLGERSAAIEAARTEGRLALPGALEMAALVQANAKTIARNPLAHHRVRKSLLGGQISFCNTLFIVPFRGAPWVDRDGQKLSFERFVDEAPTWLPSGPSRDGKPPPLVAVHPAERFQAFISDVAFTFGQVGISPKL